MSTPHNQAHMGEIAKTVLMPGDPLRAQFIAETYLENPVQFNVVRNMFGYTGTYKGKVVSVMGSGMGIPSISLYAYELYQFYGVENIIRIGSAGAFSEDLQLFDTILADSAFSESSYAMVQNNDPNKIQYPSESLNAKIEAAADRLGVELHKGTIMSSDVFYYQDEVMGHVNEIVKENNVIAVEMESFGLFATAKALGKNAACLLTVSDSIVNHQETTAQERQTSLLNMIRIALESLEEM
ncbi:MAG: purine-nucleoside phosphorylase [Erysipelotrichaceae bacterium]|nr:purine-nucleoside phosphorylase [Erysipelotrichaceae bacterium]